MSGRPRVTYTAPIVPVDLEAFDGDGEPHEIHGCQDCLPWYAEVVRDAEEPHHVLVREWHAVGCPWLGELLRTDEEED